MKTLSINIAKLISLLIFATSLTSIHLNAANQTNIAKTAYQQDKHYSLIAASSQTNQNIKDFLEPYCNTKPTVIEFFSYSCPGCRDADPHFKSFLNKNPNNAVLIRVPVVFHNNWDMPAKMYHANNQLGLTEALHDLTFAWVQNRLRANQAIDENAIKEFITSAFTNPNIKNSIPNGITADDYISTLKSSVVNRDYINSLRLLSAYHITSTPSIIVNNKYVINFGNNNLRFNDLPAILAQLTNENTTC